jgi:cytochrome P450
MRLLLKLMGNVCSNASNALKMQINKGANNRFEFKEFSRKLTVDIIASCAFGIEVKNFS